MTIRRGESWGTVGPRDPATPVVRSDRELHERLRDGVRSVHLNGGDLAHALGAPRHAVTSSHASTPSHTVAPSALVTTFVVDAYDVNWAAPDGTVGRVSCHSHCVHGSWWRGDSWWFSAGGFVDGREVLPRCHPNDGIAEALHVDAAMSLRQRYAARRRLRWGTHLPHPDLRVVRGTSLTWEANRALPLLVDGLLVARAHSVSVSVLPDAYHVSIAMGVA